jgi:predicted dienelactone hydrolase
MLHRLPIAMLMSLGCGVCGIGFADPPTASQPSTAPSLGSTGPDRSGGGYKLFPGPYSAASKTITLRGEKGEAELPLRIRYPREARQPAPLVIFSHGMGGSYDAFASLTEHWASHGYIVILPTHADSVRRQKRGGELLRDPRGYRRRVDPEGRLADVRHILDSLDEIEKAVLGAAADGRTWIDRSRIAVSGHSAGALTAQMAIGVKVRTRSSLRLQNLGDPRLAAAIIISGQGTTNRMFSKDSWSALTQPMLVITGSLDTSPASDETPASRRHPYEYAPAGDKYLLFIDGATHSSYQGNDRQARNTARLLGEAPATDLARIDSAVKSQTLAFLDAYLMQDSVARAYLRRDAVTALSREIHAEHK